MKKKFIIASLLILIALGIAWWAIIFRAKSVSQETNPIWVKTAEVKESILPLEVNAIGTLAARSVEITPETSGHVKRILFQDGTFVTKGTPLIQLDDAIYRAKYEFAKAQLNYSEQDLKRKTLLGKQGAIAKQAIDQAEADFKEKRANAEENGVILKKMTLTAPFDGMVGKSKVNQGDYVTTGQSVVTITDTKHLHIEYTVPEKYLPLLKLGQEVSIKTSTYPGKSFDGKVAFISPTIAIENRSVSLYANVPNDNNLLAAGMFVNVSQSLGTKDHVMMIPARSLVPILDGVQVYKVVDGKALAVSVSIGKRTEQNVQIIEGLSPGDTIITDGQLKVKNNSSIKIKT